MGCDKSRKVEIFYWKKIKMKFEKENENKKKRKTKDENRTKNIERKDRVCQ